MDESTHTGRARQRQKTRQNRRNRQPMVAQKANELESISSDWIELGLSFLDFLREHPILTKIISASFTTLIFLFLINLIFGSRVPPNVFIFDQAFGGLVYEEAIEQLESIWLQDAIIRLRDNSHEWLATPAELGLELNARDSIEATNGIGLAGIPFGYWIDPIVSVNEDMIQSYLEGLATDVYIAPINASYEWVDGRVQGKSGQDGTELDIESTLSLIQQQPLNSIQDNVQLFTRTLSPSAGNPNLFLSQVEEMVIAPFKLVAYNPFDDNYISFIPEPQIVSSWVAAGETNLVVRNHLVSDYISALNNDPTSGLPVGTYLDPEEVTTAINQSLLIGSMQAQITMHFYPSSYEVVAGDTGFKIARKTGIPFFLIEEVNADIDLSVLSPGDIINLPSRDVTIPLPVVANKRIIVDLQTQSMVAYEDGQVVFSWQISSGVTDAPTSPGIYQILSHEPVAYGSSYTLCGDTGCGQWELNWFMGIYEVVPGLVNGFHGAVLLPNGAYLGGNNVGVPYTLGCVMSQDEQARQLYDWAELGTIVEIISDEFAPQSDRARRALDI